MKQLLLLVVCWIFAHTVFAQNPGKASVRTWTSVNGITVEAALVSFKSGMVTLKTIDNETLCIPVAKLSASDKDFLKEPQTPVSGKSEPIPEAAASGKVVQPARPDCLPTLSNVTMRQLWYDDKRVNKSGGITIASYAVYRQPSFEAHINQNGMLTIIFLKNNKPMERTMQILHTVGKYEMEREGQKVDEFEEKQSGQEDGRGEQSIVMSDGSSIYRKMVKFTAYTPPTENASTIVLKGIFEDNIPWEGKYIFKENTITYSGKITQPENLKFPARYWIACSVVPSHEFEGTTSIEEQKKQTSHCSMKVKGGFEDPETFGYTKSYDINRYFEDLEIKGHFEPYIVKFHSSEQTRGSPFAYVYNYTGSPLYNGFRIVSDQDYDESSGKFRRYQETPTVTITIE